MGVMVGEAEGQGPGRPFPYPRLRPCISALSRSGPCWLGILPHVTEYKILFRLIGKMIPFQWPTSLPACRPPSPADESIVFQPGAEVASVFGLMVGSALRNEARTSHTSAGDKRLRATDLPASLGPIPEVWMPALSLSSPEPQKIGARIRKRAMVLNP